MDSKSIAEALFRITRQLLESRDGYGVYHFANSPFVSWHEFAVRIVSMLQDQVLVDHEIVVHPISTEQYPTPAKRPANSCLSADLIERRFSINQPKWEIELATVVHTLASSR